MSALSRSAGRTDLTRCISSCVLSYFCWLLVWLVAAWWRSDVRRVRRRGDVLTLHCTLHCTRVHSLYTPRLAVVQCVFMVRLSYILPRAYQHSLHNGIGLHPLNSYHSQFCQSSYGLNSDVTGRSRYRGLYSYTVSGWTKCGQHCLNVQLLRCPSNSPASRLYLESYFYMM